MKTWWSMTDNSVPGKLRQEDCEFEASLSYTAIASEDRTACRLFSLGCSDQIRSLHGSVIPDSVADVNTTSTA